MRLPIRPEDGFPQAFELAFDGKVYLLTTRISFLTMEPFRLWEIEHISSKPRPAYSVPLKPGGQRVTLPWALQGEAERMLYALPQDKLYLTLQVERADLPEPERVVHITRPMLYTPFRLGDLAFLFDQIHIARGNLLGPGSFGSRIEAGVMAYGA